MVAQIDAPNVAIPSFERVPVFEIPDAGRTGSAAMHQRLSPRSRRLASTTLAAVTLAFGAVGCSGEVDNSDLDANEMHGYALAIDKGCAGCHGTDFSGGVGPSWIGLIGKEVELADGSTIVADEDYIRESITDPGAKIVSGYSVQMPTVGLTDKDVEDILVYIRAESEPDAG